LHLAEVLLASQSGEMAKKNQQREIAYEISQCHTISLQV